MARAHGIESSGLPMTRREALAAFPAVVVAGSALGQNTKPAARPRIAAVVTEYRKMSHGQGIVDRFLDGYGWGGQHYHPGVDIVSLYVNQKPKGDLSEERAKRHSGLKIYPTIAEALTRGGDRLAVDGVLLIGEQGRYPRNEKGQHLYPRYEFFKQVVDVFRRDGRSVPVFNDKHLSWNWAWAKEMVETARTLGFPFMAGSSLPVTWRLPGVDVPSGAPVEEVVCVGYGGLDSYDFHGLETLQCMAERRKGGETGVVAVRALRGPAVWKALATGSWDAGGCDPELVRSVPLPQLHPGLPTAGIRQCLSRTRAVPGDRPRPDVVSDRVRRRPEGDLADAQWARPGFHRRPADQGAEPAALDADVSGGDTARADPARFLQPALAPHRDHVLDGEAHLSGRADLDDDRDPRHGRGIAPPRPGPDRDAGPPRRPLRGAPRIAVFRS